MLNLFRYLERLLGIILIFGFIHGTISFYLDLPRMDSQNTLIIFLFMIIVGLEALFESEYNPITIVRDSIVRFFFNFRIIFKERNLNYFNIIFYPILITVFITFIFNLNILTFSDFGITYVDFTNPTVLLGIFTSNFIIIYGIWDGCVSATIKKSENKQFSTTLLFSRLVNEPFSFLLLILFYGLGLIFLSVLMVCMTVFLSFIVGMILYGVIGLFTGYSPSFFDNFIQSFLPIGSSISFLFCLFWILGFSAQTYVSRNYKDD